MANKPPLDFKSKEEFRAVCTYLSGRMHYLNRVAMGEQRFAWEMADLLKRAGKVFEEHYGDTETQKAFGDGYEKGTVPREDQPAALFGLLYPEVGSDKS